MSARLLRALSEMLPGAAFYVRTERPWQSATFSGVQLCIDAEIACPENEPAVTRFVNALADHEFNLPKQLVADIAVALQPTGTLSTRLEIEALLLDH